MSAISSAEVARVAALARVALTPEEVTRLAGELDAVAARERVTRSEVIRRALAQFAA